MRCPFCREEHPENTALCPTTHQRIEGLPTEGSVIDGKYKILGVLGAGGMAVVYRAEHIKIGRAVALKFLLTDFRAVPELVERVEREARAAGTIDHANVVEIVDLGSTPEFGPHIAMELLRGVDLATHAENNGLRLPEMEAADIVRQVLSALAVAHDKGVIHRDLKPENIFLVEDEDRLRVKVVDFGISKLAEKPGQAKLTRVGTVMGTPQYMPPEQAIGAPNQDHRIDLYACGVVLYALVSGGLPYEAENFNVLISDMLNKPPTPVTFRNPELDPDLAAIVMKAIERKPDDRYQDARAMQDALVIWMKKAPVEDTGQRPKFSDSIRMRFPSVPQSVRASNPTVEPIEPNASKDAGAAAAKPVTITKDATAPAPAETAVAPPADVPPRVSLPSIPPEGGKRGSRAWLVLPVLLLAAGGGLFALRQYSPGTWDQAVTRAGLERFRVAPVDADGGARSTHTSSGNGAHASAHESSRRRTSGEGSAAANEPTHATPSANAHEPSNTASSPTTNSTPDAGVAAVTDAGAVNRPAARNARNVRRPVHRVVRRNRRSGHH